MAFALGIQKLRSRLVTQATGQVLELAVGTGLNLPLYNAALIDAYTGLDLSPEMLSQVTVQVLKLSATNVHACLLMALVSHGRLSCTELGLPAQDGSR